MAVTQQELGRRLRVAREASRMTQQDVAHQLKVSRSTVAQMELGNRAVTGLELDRLAYLYGRDISEFLKEQFQEEDALVAVFRRHPEVSEQEEVRNAMRECMAIGHEITNLERLLGINRNSSALAVNPLSLPNNKWEAIEQGDRVAGEERRRLGLGKVPLPNIAELLEAHGVRTAQVYLPEDVSGLTLMEPDIGLLVVSNLRHHFLRRRFSCAHEYCHVLLDRDRQGTISLTSDREDLSEVRANAFAASFLMPEEGVREFVHGVAKGRPSRLQADVFDEEQALSAISRPKPGSQAIQMYDVVLLAHHFGVSRISALYRLKNLKLINGTEFDALKAQDERGLGQEIAEMLYLPPLEHAETRKEFRHRFLGLALEAYRRGEITLRKLHELAEMVEVPVAQLDRILVKTGLDESGEASGVLLPGE